MPADLAQYLMQSPHDRTMALAPGQAEVREDPRARAFYELTGQQPNTPTGEFVGNTLQDFGTQAALEAAPLALGPAGKVAAKAAPHLGKLLLMGGGAGLGAAEAGGDEEGTLESLMRERGGYVAARDAAQQAMERERATGEGPRFKAAQAAYEKAEGDLAGVQGLIEVEQAKNSPEALLEQQKQLELYEEEKQRRRQNMPFAEAHPEIAQALPVIGLGGAAIAGGALGRRLANQGNQLLAKFNAAKQGGNTVDMAEALQQMKAMRGQALKDTAKIAGAGAGIGVEARAAGDIFDAVALPEDSTARQAARDKLFDPINYAKGSVVPALGGAATALSFGKLANRGPHGAEVKGLLNSYDKTLNPRALADQLQKGSRASTDLQDDLLRLGQAQRSRGLSGASDREAARRLGARDQAGPQADQPGQLKLESKPATSHHSHRQNKSPDGRFSGGFKE